MFPSGPSSIFNGNMTVVVSRGCVPSSVCPASFSLMIAGEKSFRILMCFGYLFKLNLVNKVFFLIGYGIAMSCCNTNLCNTASLVKIENLEILLSLVITFFFNKKY